MVTISDVAAEAGISTATVSRALNGNPQVKPELAARARAAAERLGYRPNGIARSLRRQATNVLALIISDVSNPFFTAVTRGVEDVAQEAGYSVLLCNADEDSGKEARYLGVAIQQQVAGVILSPHQLGTDVSSLTSAKIPLVVIDRPINEEIDSVMVRSREGASKATEHLIDAGWRHPACITGPEDANTAEERLRGYLDAVARHPGYDPAFAHAPFRESGGSQAAAELLDRPDPPDAFFVANSQLALGALAEFQRRGLTVGSDIGLVAFDDTPWATLISPPMSVVSQPAYKIGETAARLLMQRIRSDDDISTHHITLPTTLVERGSSRKHGA